MINERILYHLLGLFLTVLHRLVDVVNHLVRALSQASAVRLGLLS